MYNKSRSIMDRIKAAAMGAEPGGSFYILLAAAAFATGNLTLAQQPLNPQCG